MTNSEQPENEERPICINCGIEFIRLDSTNWICPCDGNVVGVSDLKLYENINQQSTRGEKNDSENR